MNEQLNRRLPTKPAIILDFTRILVVVLSIVFFLLFLLLYIVFDVVVAAV